MTSWVLSIDAGHEAHWDRARESGFWDMTVPRNIKKDDLVYFWLSGQSFRAKTRVLYDLRPKTPRDVEPWEDSGCGTTSTASGFRCSLTCP